MSTTSRDRFMTDATEVAAASGPLSGTRLVVLGAAGEIGEGLVREALRHGADVVAVSRSSERLAALEASLRTANLHNTWTRRFTPLQGGVHSEAGAEALAAFFSETTRRPVAVIASLGGWRQGAFVTDTALSVWHEAFEQSLTAHMLAARALLPLIATEEGASYTLVNGGAALRAVPGAGAMCVSAAGQLMLMRVLSAEYKQDPVRINTLLLDTPVRTRSRLVGPPSWISASDAGAAGAYLASRASTLRGEVLVLDHPDARKQLGAPFA